MAGQHNVPDTHHVARYVKPKLCILESGGHRVIGVYPEAFELRENDSYLSTTWCEFFEEDGLRTNAACALRAITKSGLSPNKNGALAIVKVGTAKRAGSVELGNLRFVHEPKKSPGNPAYVPVYGTKKMNADVLKRVFCEASLQDLFTIRDLQLQINF